MDLSKLDTQTKSDEGVWIHLRHPVTGMELDTEFHVYGVDSDRFKAVNDRIVERRRRSTSLLPDQKTRDAENMERLLECVDGWRHMEWEGKELPFSRDNLEMIYTRRRWVTQQIDIMMADRQHFLSE